MSIEQAFTNPNIPPEYGALLDRVEECLSEGNFYLSMVNPQTGADWESRVRVVDTEREEGRVKDLHGSIVMLAPHQTEAPDGLDVGLGYTVTVYHPTDQRMYDLKPTTGYVRRPGTKDSELSLRQYENMLFLLDHSRPATPTEYGDITRAMTANGLKASIKGAHSTASLVITLANGRSVVI